MIYLIEAVAGFAYFFVGCVTGNIVFKLCSAKGYDVTGCLVGVTLYVGWPVILPILAMIWASDKISDWVCKKVRRNDQ